MPLEQAPHDDVARRAIDALNKHGHAFQHTVIREAVQAADSGESRWGFQGAELPVELGGHETRIDFLLQLEDHRPPWYLVAECKRVDPARSDWIFTRAPYMRPDRPREPARWDSIHRREGGWSASVAEAWIAGHSWNITNALKGSQKGDRTGTSDDIERACSQVLRGVGGFIGHITKFLLDAERAVVVPVTFTTAKLWTVDVDLSSASLQDGRLSVEEPTAAAVDWLWLQYHRSPSLSHSLEIITPEQSMDRRLRDYRGDDLQLALRFIRTIAIVSPSGIRDFLGDYWYRGAEV